MEPTPTSTTSLLPQRQGNNSDSSGVLLIGATILAILAGAGGSCYFRNQSVSLEEELKEKKGEITSYSKELIAAGIAKEECNKKYEELTTERDSFKTKLESCDNELKLCATSKDDLEQRLDDCQRVRSTRRSTTLPPQTKTTTVASTYVHPKITTNPSGEVLVNDHPPAYYDIDLFNPLRKTNSEFGDIVGLNFIRPCQDGTLTGTALYRFVVYENRIYTLPLASQNNLKPTKESPTINDYAQIGNSYNAILSALDQKVVPHDTRNGIYNIELICKDNKPNGGSQ